MTTLTRIPKELGSFITSISNPEEQQTAIEVITKLHPTLERKSHANADNLLIAAGLYEIRQKHGYKAEVYQTMLEGIATLDEAWADKHYRSEWLEAYNGYMCLPGSEDDKACILKMNPSRSALAAVRRIPDRMVYKFFMEVKKNGVFPTAAAIEKYAKQGRLTSSSSSTTKTAPTVNKVENETVTPPVVDVESTPVVEPETPTVQEMEELPSANIEEPTVDVIPIVEHVSHVQAVSSDFHAFSSIIDRMNNEIWELNKVIHTATPEQKRSAEMAAKYHLQAAERLYNMLRQYASV